MPYNDNTNRDAYAGVAIDNRKGSYAEAAQRVTELTAQKQTIQAELDAANAILAAATAALPDGTVASDIPQPSANGARTSDVP